ncbi:protein of unknown function [Tenacibaculum aestuariivivum]
MEVFLFLESYFVYLFVFCIKQIVFSLNINYYIYEKDIFIYSVITIPFFSRSKPRSCFRKSN